MSAPEDTARPAPAAPAGSASDSPHELLNPRHWKAAKGYANGILAEGRLIFVGGLVGWNAEQAFESDRFVDQARQALANVVEVLAEAGAGPEHLVRLTWYVTDKQEYLASLRELGQAYRATIGRHFPAMAMVQVTALVEDRAKVEIEATAVLPRG
jgi:enamine deaminase RidA (YjgF/YER057c/UK114 family)